MFFITFITLYDLFYHSALIETNKDVFCSVCYEQLELVSNVVGKHSINFFTKEKHPMPMQLLQNCCKF